MRGLRSRARGGRRECGNRTEPAARTAHGKAEPGRWSRGAKAAQEPADEHAGAGAGRLRSPQDAGQAPAPSGGTAQGGQASLCGSGRPPALCAGGVCTPPRAPAPRHTTRMLRGCRGGGRRGAGAAGACPRKGGRLFVQRRTGHCCRRCTRRRVIRARRGWRARRATVAREPTGGAGLASVFPRHARRNKVSRKRPTRARESSGASGRGGRWRRCQGRG